MKRKSICVTAKQRSEAAARRAFFRRLRKAVREHLDREWAMTASQRTIVDRFCEAFVGAMHESAGLPIPPGPHAYVTAEEYNRHQQ